jgi:hypothetical protein
MLPCCEAHGPPPDIQVHGHVSNYGYVCPFPRPTPGHSQNVLLQSTRAHAVVHDDASLRSLLQSADACVVRSVDSTELTVLGWLVHVQLDALQEIASTAALRVLPLLEAAGAAATSSAASASANASVMMTTTH